MLKFVIIKRQYNRLVGSNPLQVLLTLLVKRILNVTSVSIHRTEWRNMYNLKYADYDGIYHGFNLKKELNIFPLIIYPKLTQIIKWHSISG